MSENQTTTASITPIPFATLRRFNLIPGRSIATSSFERYEQSLGHYFFTPDNARFFHSRWSALAEPCAEGWVLVTSELDFHDRNRAYSVRLLKFDGTVDNLGEFREYATRSRALTAARNYAAAHPYLKE